MEVLAKDTLAFQLLLPYNSGLGSMYWNVPFLFKPGPSPSAVISIVRANFAASSGPVTHLLIGFKQEFKVCICE